MNGRIENQQVRKMSGWQVLKVRYIKADGCPLMKTCKHTLCPVVKSAAYMLHVAPVNLFLALPIVANPATYMLHVTPVVNQASSFKHVEVKPVVEPSDL